jgi:PTS system nitrogen regulatory IIA component
MNRISQLLPAGNIVVALEVRDKSAALEAAAAVFSNSTGLDKEKIRASLAAREQMGSTGLGMGVAIPHGRVRGIKRAVAAILKLVRPIAFDAPDGRPVGLLVALLVPEFATQEHLEVLSELAQMLSDREFRERLLLATTGDTLGAHVAAWEPIRPAA